MARWHVALCVASIALAPLAAGCGALGESDGELVLVETTISSDNNDDGIVNPGETVCLRLTVANVGDAQVPSSDCILTSDSASVVVQDSQSKVSLNSCDHGDCYQVRVPCVEISDDVQPGDELHLSCDLEDQDGGHHPLDIVLEVQATGGQLQAFGLEVTGDENGDGVVNPGETPCLTLRVRNAGSSEISSTEGVLTSTSGDVTIPEGQETYTFNTCAPGATCYGVRRACIEVDQDVAAGALLPFGVTLVDRESNDYPLSFDVRVEATAAQLVLAGVTISSDTERGPRVHPDEHVCLKLDVRNVGVSDAGSSECTLTSLSGGATVSDGQELASFNSCSVGARCYPVRSPCLDVSAVSNPGDSLTLECALVEQQGAMHPLEILLTVD